MNPIISVNGLCKTYRNGFKALNDVSLDIHKGEILALLGPNGAGKTTMISIICGIVNGTAGSVTVDGFDIVKDFRKTRKKIGLVPQELTLGAFEQVINTLKFSRGLFGREPDDDYLEQLLKKLSLWEKRNSEILALSGGMKRRVLIAKALAHEPDILFLDEPTAGVDVDLRKDMWRLVENLRQTGVTIILTTHYIEEAEAIADRVGVINKGELLLVDDKTSIMHKLGNKQIFIDVENLPELLPKELASWNITMDNINMQLIYTYDQHQPSRITQLLDVLKNNQIRVTDINTRKSSLEDIFVTLVNRQPGQELQSS